MIGDTPWIVPGAPLEDGKGWRMSYTRRGHDDSTPPDPAVELLGRGRCSVTTSWEPLERYYSLALAGPSAGVSARR